MKSTSLVAKVENFIEEENLLTWGDKVVLGVSGGADSVCLFEVLKSFREKYKLTLKVVCVNHGLRPEAKEEAGYVKSLCDKAEIDFVERKADVAGFAKENGLGTEEAGRILRYKYFDEIATAMGDGTKIAVAHNKNDVAETFLFNLFRGTGPKGLASLKSKRDQIIRPLLCVERFEIEEFLKSSEIKYYTDASNLTDAYSRNKIRHHILDYAKEEINDGSVSHICAAADYIRQLNDIVEGQVGKSLSSEIVSQRKNEVIVERKAFAGEEDFVAGMKAKMCIDMLVPQNKDITSAHLMAIKDIAKKDGTHKWDLPYDIHVTASGNLVKFKLGEEENEDVRTVLSGEKGSVRIDGLGKLEWEVYRRPEDFVISQKQYTKSFDYDKMTQCLVLRKPLSSDYLTINSKLQKKKLSDYFTNEKIPIFIRESSFVLADENHVWWVPGMRISEYPKVTDETKTIITVTIYKEDCDGKASC